LITLSQLDQQTIEVDSKNLYKIDYLYYHNNSMRLLFS